MSNTTRLFVLSSLLALVTAAVMHLLVLFGVSGVWAAMIHVAIFGWITMMIFGVNYHTMPVFAARDFPYPWLLQIHWLVSTLGVALAAPGLGTGLGALINAGVLLQLLGALVFVANTVLLFVRGPRRAHKHPPPPVPNQAAIDRVGTQATKLAGMCLPLALLLLLVHPFWLRGEWGLAAEHLALLGWVMLMIVGVAYHVLPRFSARAVRGVAWARAQLLCHVAGLVVIVPSLGLGWRPAFAAGGLLMSAAVGLFAWTIWPTLRTVDPRRATISLQVKEQPR